MVLVNNSDFLLAPFNRSLISFYNQGQNLKVLECVRRLACDHAFSPYVHKGYSTPGTRKPKLNAREDVLNIT